MTETPIRYAQKQHLLTQIEEDIAQIVREEGGDPAHIAKTRFGEQLKVIAHLKEETKRDLIADLIRGLTYRELCQMGDELLKKRAPKDAPDGIDMPQTLDDWAHWVLEGETDVNKQGTTDNTN